jgi:hypothetical protein
VDEFWFWVSPPCGGPDRVFRWSGPVRLELIGSTTFPLGRAAAGLPAGTPTGKAGRRRASDRGRAHKERSAGWARTGRRSKSAGRPNGMSRTIS